MNEKQYDAYIALKKLSYLAPYHLVVLGLFDSPEQAREEGLRPLEESNKVEKIMSGIPKQRGGRLPSIYYLSGGDSPLLPHTAILKIQDIVISVAQQKKEEDVTIKGITYKIRRYNQELIAPKEHDTNYIYLGISKDIKRIEGGYVCPPSKVIDTIVESIEND